MDEKTNKTKTKSFKLLFTKPLGKKNPWNCLKGHKASFLIADRGPSAWGQGPGAVARLGSWVILISTISHPEQPRALPVRALTPQLSPFSTEVLRSCRGVSCEEQELCAQAQVPPLSCVTLGRGSNLSGPWFPNLYNGNPLPALRDLLW